MKKLILTLFAFFSVSSAMATQTIQVVWPFAPGSSQAVMYRHLLDSANKQQNKYTFVFVNKPGAGGTIAAQYVASNPTTTILASTTSFYSRPMLYHESHNINDFTLTNTVCLDAPLAIFSRKYKIFNDLKNREATIGVLPGSVTQLLTQTIARDNPDIKFTEIPYKGTIEASTDMIAGHIDASVDLLATGVLTRMPESVSVVGITGPRTIRNIPTLSSFGVKGLEKMTNNYFMFTHQSVSNDFKKEISDIFNRAVNDQVRDGCVNENGVLETLNFANSDRVHKANTGHWEKLTQGFKKQ